MALLAGLEVHGLQQRDHLHSALFTQLLGNNIIDLKIIIIYYPIYGYDSDNCSEQLSLLWSASVWCLENPSCQKFQMVNHYC